MATNDAAHGQDGAALTHVTPTTAGAIIAAMHADGGALDVPKPFAEPICLVPDTRVAGTGHVGDIDRLARALKTGDRLRLERDAKNRYDRWSIRVLTGEGERLGHVCADVNEIPARLMDGGKRLFAEVTDVDRRGEWWRIAIGVWLDD